MSVPSPVAEDMRVLFNLIEDLAKRDKVRRN